MSAVGNHKNHGQSQKHTLVNKQSADYLSNYFVQQLFLAFLWWHLAPEIQEVLCPPDVSENKINCKTLLILLIQNLPIHIHPTLRPPTHTQYL